MSEWARERGGLLTRSVSEARWRVNERAEALATPGSQTPTYAHTRIALFGVLPLRSPGACDGSDRAD